MKLTRLVLATAVATAFMSMTALAAGWVLNGTGWWYDYGNGTWPASCWMWIDGNQDGIAECYYFDQYGYIIVNGTTPDGYTVDANGAWTINGAVQVRSTAGTNVTGAGSNEATDSGNSSNTGNNSSSNSSRDLNLMHEDPIYEHWYYTDTDARTSLNELWSNAKELGGNTSSAQYVAGGNYRTFEATVAPIRGFKDDESVTLEIYGDNDTLLYTQDFTYQTRPVDLSVDITGQDYIRLYLIGYSNWRSDCGALLLKNMYFRN